jgi:hypothetical protein
MKNKLNQVTEWLLCASSEIGSEYFQLPVAEKEEPEYRERVYCYELYHRWRCHWTRGFPYSLSGEVDKQGHPLVRGGEKPDFLVHIPGTMSNLLVVEVKPRNAELTRMAEDLKKLTRFRRDLPPQDGSGNYYAAYFWLYGLETREWKALWEQVRRGLSSSQFDPRLVSCFVHERAGARAIPVGWE